ncbi:hypothetical protein JCM14722_11310 [Pseudodesulfovibrio portus]|uniref:IPT/TIG domain-containing protein n=2 Tax=Pseudodesulfovibrio portus TaxID=231439 RepID=A0ABN6RRJ7_9BACT|nr:hypothetical protein JCM14722_11310 [Pseudodesulfovibrio portus]
MQKTVRHFALGNTLSLIPATVQTPAPDCSENAFDSAAISAGTDGVNITIHGRAFPNIGHIAIGAFKAMRPDSL